MRQECKAAPSHIDRSGDLGALGLGRQPVKFGNVASLRIATGSRCYQTPSASLHRRLAILPGTRSGTSATHPTKKERSLVTTRPVPCRGYSIGTHTPERSCLGRLMAGAIRTSGSPTAPAQGFEGGALGRAAPRRSAG